MPAQKRKEHWKHLSQTLELRLPDLAPPSWVAYSIMLGFLLFWIAAVTTAVTDSVYLGLSCFIGSFLFLWLANAVAAPLTVCLPSGCDTVSSLVKTALRLNYGLYTQRSKTWSQVEVWEMLKQVVSEELSVPLEKVTEDADLILDLEVDGLGTTQLAR